MPKESKTAVVTGGSSGIGAVFARHLAQRGYDLMLVARRRDRLDAIAEELAGQHRVGVEILTADLSEAGDVGRVQERLEALPALEMLVNNAGFGTRHRFVDLDPAMHVDMVHVHVTASVRLIRTVLPGMIERGRGAIINVSSLAGFIPMPKSVTYAATKAFLITLSEGLAKELAGTGVRVQALCPGFTYTEFHDAAEFEGFDRSDISRKLWMPADDVVSESLASLEAGRVVCVPGRRNRILLAVSRSWIGPALARALARKRWE
ncbi:MAG: SDR family oxidoreductase [Phycisphaerae bacterium]|nr:SDR family oxidoreductase [Phycisphaerae bacterium]